VFQTRRDRVAGIGIARYAPNEPGFLKLARPRDGRRPVHPRRVWRGREKEGKDAVLNKRFEEREEYEAGGSELAAETARSAAESSAADRPRGTDDEKVSLFWRVFGGTILSMIALGTITLYNSISSNIAELRNELNREREARSELVRKDEFNSRTSNQYERIRSFDGMKAEHEALKERINANGAALDALKKDSAGTADAVKRDAAALEVLKERLTALEGLKKEVAAVELLRERLAAAAADLKTVRDDVAVIQREVERNRAGDNERKASRDAQFKQVEESLKEVQKGLQECREKLARLEGARPGRPPSGKPDGTPE
jgi:archaellum component FlaC